MVVGLASGVGITFEGSKGGDDFFGLLSCSIRCTGVGALSDVRSFFAPSCSELSRRAGEPGRVELRRSTASGGLATAALIGAGGVLFFETNDHQYSDEDQVLAISRAS